MPDLDDDDIELVISDFTHNPVDALSGPIPLLRGQLLAPFAARIFAKRFDSFQNLPDVFFRDIP
jgi:hypothetical protein